MRTREMREALATGGGAASKTRAATPVGSPTLALIASDVNVGGSCSAAGDAPDASASAGGQVTATLTVEKGGQPRVETSMPVTPQSRQAATADPQGTDTAPEPEPPTRAGVGATEAPRDGATSEAAPPGRGRLAAGDAAMRVVVAARPQEKMRAATTSAVRDLSS